MGRLLLLIMFSFLRFASLCAGVSVQAVLGNPFTLRENCQNDEEGKLLRSEPHGEVEVALHQQSVWTPAQGYQGRIRQNSSVIFAGAFYSDGGAYVLRCGGRETRIQVKVLVPFNVTVREGKSATLPCYYQTTGNKCVSALWVKNEKVVLERNSCTGEGVGHADHRLSVSPDWFLRAAFFLKLQRAKNEDQGNYFCYVEDEDGKKERRYPSVVRLKVKNRSHHQRKSVRRIHKKPE